MSSLSYGYGAAPGSSGASAASHTSSSASGHGNTVRHAQGHPEYTWYGVLSLLALATLVNALYLVWATYRRYRARRSSDAKTVAARQSTGRLSYRRIPQAFLSASRILGFRLLIPHVDMLVVEIVVTILYLGGLLAYTFAPTDNVLPHVNLQPRYWGNFAGKVAAIQVPLVVALAMKNNPITWITGIGHEKLNMLHRVTSRCVLLFTWLHCVGMYYRSVATWLDETWKVLGLVGAVAQTITTIIGIKAIRRRFYEFFYATHIILVLIFLITLLLHVIPPESAVLVWPVFVLWGFDRLVRFGRYALFNFVLRPKNGAKALVEVISLGGLRVTLKRRIPGGWRAGQHVFIAFPTLGPESHPFTIANAYEREEGGKEGKMVFIIRTMEGQTRKLIERALEKGTCELPAMVDGPYGHPEDIRAYSTCVFIAGGTGVVYTLSRMHQLFKDIAAGDACAKRVVFVWAIRIDGEYQWLAADLAKVLADAPPNLSLSVDVHVTGGRTLVESHIQSLPGPHKRDGTATARAAEVEKDGSSLDEKSASHEDSAGSAVDISGIACLPDRQAVGTRCDSRPTTAGSTFPAPATDSHPVQLPPACVAAGVRRQNGRPHVHKILEEEVTTAQGPVSVDVCGSDSLVNAVRGALSAPFAGPMAVLKGAPTVMLNVDQFRM